MTLEGVDYADGRPGGAALAAAGIRFAARYVPYGGYAKGLAGPEVRDLHAHGIAIVLNFEQVATRALQGRAAGIADGHTSLAAAAALGFPADRPVYLSCDFNPTAAQLAAVFAYFEGADSVLGLARTGAYAGGNLLRALAARHLASWFWNAASTSWGKLYAGAHIWQYRTGSMGARPINGAAVDYDRALQADFGQWPAPPVQEASMIYTLGGVHTGEVGAGVAYSREPGGPRAGDVTPGRYLLTATDATGAHVALDGLWQATTPLGVPVACGWIPRSAVSLLQALGAPGPTTPATPAPKVIAVTVGFADGSSQLVKGV